VSLQAVTVTIYFFRAIIVIGCVMASVVEKLQQVGLTEYEAKAYLALLNTHLSTATQASEKSGVPRTKIYSVLEALRNKGWVRVYSGVPLLFKAVQPMRVFEKAKEDYAELLDSIKTTLKEEVNNVKEKFVIKRFDVGLEGLKEEIKKAKTVEINNATASFVKKVSDAFRPDAMVKVLLFPGEVKPNNMQSVQFKQAEVAIVTIMRNREVPSMSIILDEGRTFTAFQDPVDHKYIIDEFLYDECSRCFAEWSNLSWSSATQP
jgi:sugar-specific transcriptional regulator TrmB